MKRKLNGTSKRRLFFAHSLHMLKRQCPPLPATLVAAAVEKHQIALTQQRSSPIDCKNFVKIFVFEELKHFKTDVNLFSPLSRNSCVELSRSHGGAQGKLSAGVKFGKTFTTDLRRMAIINSYAETSAKEFHAKSTTNLALIPNQTVKVRCVDDPLKARIITVEPIINQRLKQVTTDLNRYLRKREQFKLVGGFPVDQLVRELPPLKEGHKFVSGDYSAATDNLNSDICAACAQSVSKYLPVSLQELYLQNASMHNLVYPSGASVLQTNGQLMGSLSSFNNLSLINSALFSFVRSGNPDAFSEWHYVNGDDILFTATPEGLEEWKSVVSECGLSPSYGKNYFSRNYFTINSQFFRHEEYEIPYVNFNLLRPLGNDKRNLEIGSKSRQVSVVSSSALGSAWRGLCTRANVKIDVKAHLLRKSFLRTHSRDLLRIGKNLLLPVPWGGCGAMNIKEVIEGDLPLDIYMIRDIAHRVGSVARDSVTAAAEAFGNLLEVLPPGDRIDTTRDSSRLQYVFSGCTEVSTPKTRKPCRHCLSLRPILCKNLTPSLVGIIHGSHTH
jgi:hypothetical protein